MKMAMETEAHAFFRQHVLPAIQDWHADETAIHKAMLVATNLNHMADYYWKSFSHEPHRVFGARSLNEFREKLQADCPAYALIRDVCDAHKHLTLDRSTKRVTNAGQTSTARLGWGESKWGDGRWGSPEEVVVTDDSGEKHHFIALVRRTEEKWKHLLLRP